MPLYTSVATTFADLHDRAGRMKAKGVIRESISWRLGRGFGPRFGLVSEAFRAVWVAFRWRFGPRKDSRRYFFWRVKRRVLQDHLIGRLRAADEKLSHKGAEAMVQKWAAESKVDFGSDTNMARGPFRMVC